MDIHMASAAPLRTRLPDVLSALRVSAWISGVVALVSAGVIGSLFFYYLQTSPFVDFEAYHSGALAVRHGEPIYERATIYRDAGYSWNHPWKHQPIPGFPYLYPAAFAIAFVPFTFLAADIAMTVWSAITYTCLLGAAYALSGLFFPARLLDRLAATLSLGAMFALFQPVRAALYTGQAEPVLLFLMALSLSAFLRGRDLRAGLWLGVAAAVKPFLGFVILYFLWKRSYRAAASTILVSAVLILAPAAVIGVGTLTEFVEVAATFGGPAWAVSPQNQAPYGFLLRLLSENPYTVPLVEAPGVAAILRWLIAGGAIVMLGSCLSRSRTQPTSYHVLEWGLVLIAMLMIAPLVQDIYFAYLLIPLLATAVALWEGRLRNPAPLMLAVVAVYTYFSLPTLRTVSQGFYAFYQAPLSGASVLLTGAHVYGLIAVGMLTLVALTRQRWLIQTEQPGRAAGLEGALRDSQSEAEDTRTSAPMLSVVIPAYNEEARLPRTLEHVRAYLAGRSVSFEIVVVDDGSADRTCEEVEQAAARDGRIRLIRAPHRGKGAAVRLGALAAVGESIIFCDADLSQSVEELTRLPARLVDAEVVIASREAAGANRVGEPEHRHRMGRIFNLIVRTLAVPGVRDTQCGLKCFSRSVARELFARQTVEGFGFDVELLFLARKLGYRILEVPIAWHHVPGSRVDPLRDSTRMFVDVVRVRLNDLRGRYDRVPDSAPSGVVHRPPLPAQKRGYA